MRGPAARSIQERFNEKYQPITESGCWIWTAGQSDSGYGCMQIGTFKKQKKMNAHKLSYILHKGEVPEGMLVLHKCDVRACVNPDHLYLGTYSDNIQDAYDRNRR